MIVGLGSRGRIVESLNGRTWTADTNPFTSLAVFGFGGYDPDTKRAVVCGARYSGPGDTSAIVATADLILQPSIVHGDLPWRFVLGTVSEGGGS